MNSLACIRPGVFEYRQLEEIEWMPGNTLLRIKRIGICGTDLHAFEGTQPFFDYPRILGDEIAADVAKTDAIGFYQNELVTFIPYFNCNACIACRNGKPNCCANIKVCGVHIDGGMSEYFLVPSSTLLHGENLNVDELALIEPFSIGAHALRRAEIKPGDFVLIIGAGPIGIATMELAKIAGANVIAMDMNETRLNFCRQNLQLEHVINPGSFNPLEQLKEITDGNMPDVVFDATGNLKAINHAFQYISHGGKYVLIGLQKEEIKFSHPEFHKREATLMSSRNATRTDFLHVIDCFKNKRINLDHYITHRLKFDEVKDRFASLLNPENKVIKAVIEMD